jgi:hypothetical protein
MYSSVKTPVPASVFLSKQAKLNPFTSATRKTHLIGQTEAS